MMVNHSSMPTHPGPAFAATEFCSCRAACQCEVILAHVQHAGDNLRRPMEREHAVIQACISAALVASARAYCLLLVNVSGAPPWQGFALSKRGFIPKTKDADEHDHFIRSPEAPRPLMLCNCDCKALTTAMRHHEYAMECIHPAQMTDNIFQIETAALAQRACIAVLQTDFAFACPSVNQQWILAVLS